MQRLLTHHEGFPWVSENEISAKGYAYTPDGSYTTATELLHYLLHEIVAEGLSVKMLSHLNGMFSFIYQTETEVFLYCDKSRFFPLFFRLLPDLIICDEPELLIQDVDSIDIVAAEEFRCTGYTTGHDTLIEQIKQVPAGELVIIGHDHKIKRFRVFSYKVSHAELLQTNDPLNAMKLAIEKAAERFIRSIGDATPVIPLSGGYDSRLIACILKSYGYSNTICFTYGLKSMDVEISEKVAQLLGFKWYYIDYAHLPEEEGLLSKQEFIAYYKYTSHLTSMFFLQEYPAVKFLKKNNLIPENSIFLPGHSGDLLGGSQFMKVFPVNIKHNQLVNLILQKKYTNYPIMRSYAGLFKKRIADSLDDLGDSITYSMVEDWDIKEKIAKFIINSSQVYTFFGYRVSLLFWDEELVDFFRCLPPNNKRYKFLYDLCLKQNFFDKYGLNFKKELSPAPLSLLFQQVKNFVKPILPRPIKQKFIIKNDWVCYKKFTQPMLDEIDYPHRKKLPYNGFNSVIINWYLQKVINRFSS
jgi:asparagine synthase (glutamine-hydrolysing)